MSAPMETIWKIEEHTKAKHRILRECWNGWLPILAQTHPVVTYFEGFAGPGVYVGGEPGSPIVALEAAINHQLRANFRQVIFYLVEQRRDRVARLASEIELRRPRTPAAWKT